MKCVVGFGLVWLCLLCPARGQTNGIFADFSTSKGAFTVYLDYERAPRAVASFVGLATGEKAWADPQGNIWNKPFYNASIFHRVVKGTNALGVTNGMAIQGGGLPSFATSFESRPTGVATSVYLGTLVVTHVPGVNSNVLSLPVPVDYAAAVATNYRLGAKTVATNASMVTAAQVSSVVVSSNRLLPGMTNRDIVYSGFTNGSLAVKSTTLTSRVTVVWTNESGSNVVTTHSIRMEAVTSNTLQVPVGITNFSNAGYSMLESVTNGLAHSNGVISMANSGPNTDGSQFFIMTTNWPSWNGSYSVFGHVTTGMNVVTSIAAVAVQGQWERPVEDVALHSVTIRRVGAAAAGFNIASQGVPVVESGFMSATPAGTNLILRVEQIPQSKLLFCESESLESWNFSNWGFYTGVSTVVTGSVSLASLGNKYFFHSALTRFPVPVSSLSSPRGRYFTFWWNTVPAVKYEVIFNANWLVQGQYRVTSGTNSPILGLVFIGDSWVQEPYSARLGFQDDSGQVFNYSLGFNPGQATNRFTMSSGVSGLFVVQ